MDLFASTRYVQMHTITSHRRTLICRLEPYTNMQRRTSIPNLVLRMACHRTHMHRCLCPCSDQTFLTVPLAYVLCHLSASSTLMYCCSHQPSLPLCDAFLVPHRRPHMTPLVDLQHTSLLFLSSSAPTHTDSSFQHIFAL